MPRLANPAALYARYGTHEFNSTTQTVGLSIRPEKTGDGRATSYNRWQVTLEEELDAPNGTTDTKVQTTIAQLSHQGEEFVFNGRGLGNPSINTGSTVDLKFGPETSIDKIEILGAGKAVRITWTVSFCIPACPDAWGQLPTPFLEIVYNTSFQVDDAGFTTRLCSGWATIANNRTRPGSIAARASADDYRADVLTPMIPGFHRRFKPWQLSADNSKLSFGWDDDEMPVVLPENVVDLTMEDSLSSQASGLVAWSGTISATYRLRRGGDGRRAAAHFLQQVRAICKEREEELKRLKDAKGNKKDKAKFVVVVPAAFSAKNPNRYGKPAASFTFSYTFSCPLADLFIAANLWKPVKAITWDKWAASLAGSALHPYGGARAQMRVANDPIFDPCYPRGRPDQQLPTSGAVENADNPEDASTSLSNAFPAPDADSSWLKYECTLTIESDSGTVIVKTIPPSAPSSDSNVFSGEDPARVPPSIFDGYFNKFGTPAPTLPPEPTSTTRNDVGSVESTSGTTPAKPTTTKSSTATCVAILEGFAARVGFPIDPPVLEDVGGVTPEPASRPDMGEGFTTGTGASVVHTIYFAVWKLRYLLPAVPTGKILPPSNPLLEPAPDNAPLT